jgi:hypothetical protein
LRQLRDRRILPRTSSVFLDVRLSKRLLAPVCF